MGIYLCYGDCRASGFINGKDREVVIVIVGREGAETVEKHVSDNDPRVHPIHVALDCH